MKYYLGLDIGGTKIEGVLINQKGKILKKYRHPTEAHKSKKQILDNIFKVIEKLQIKKISGLGVGVPVLVISPN